MKQVTNSEEWFDLADFDLNSAKFLTAMKPFPAAIICYHCQQSAEKFLKGLLAYYGEPIIKTHNLFTLTKVCMKHDESFRALLDDCIVLNDYGVDVRYASHEEVNEDDTKEAIISAENIRGFILNKIKK
ncbi:DNA-binding protein [Bacillus sp. AFS054943]|uniref:DNA-binding protein n=1 Tax=Bacillus cereus TaxID=1396 RepID=A0A2C1LQD7_BACCE|nr:MULTISPECIES: HEPN domain-containing protein [Bacillus]MBE7123140.1 HEPN domain-containing protein [Bacillus cereus]PGL78074.1 DNA-binding protein [Bacillus sp. AFS054943]PGT99860.1 DNA-binding protein [Bacillus cereus]TKI38692.1 HEPN domain-containing protein [Bacillus mycoides]